MKYILICPNGEPEISNYAFYGPFDGPDHAALYRDLVHCNIVGDISIGRLRSCGYSAVDKHLIEGLDEPRTGAR